jgi:hypothetical protein
MAVKTNISFFRGEDITLTVTVTDENIAGWGLAFSVAKGYGQTAVFTKTTAALEGIVRTDEANGEFEVTIADIDTDALATGNYVWDVKRTDAGQEAVLAYGQLNLKPNVA